MPKREPAVRPTTAELEILRVLWQRGPSTVREVHESLRRRDRIGYTTVLKLLQIMTAKGLVTRDVSARTHVYAAAASQSTTQRRLVADLTERVFGGSTLGLVLHALSTSAASPEEPDQIHKLLDQKREGSES
jgi:predicted transcriptional regulator